MNVNNVNALFAYAKGQTDLAGSKADEAVSESFGQVMTKYSGSAGSQQAAGSSIAAGQTVMPVNTVKTEVTSPKTDQVETDGPGQNVSESISSDAETNTQDTVADKLETAGEELVQDIADELGVSREEVEEAMAVLGLTALQLFDPDNLRQLLLSMSGNTDELALLTDESLYGSYRIC